MNVAAFFHKNTIAFHLFYRTDDECHSTNLIQTNLPIECLKMLECDSYLLLLNENDFSEEKIEMLLDKIGNSLLQEHKFIRFYYKEYLLIKQKLTKAYFLCVCSTKGDFLTDVFFSKTNHQIELYSLNVEIQRLKFFNPSKYSQVFLPISQDEIMQHILNKTEIEEFLLEVKQAECKFLKSYLTTQNSNIFLAVLSTTNELIFAIID
jgi:hypothetical protein